MENYQVNSDRGHNALVSPRGARERLQTKRQQFEAIIQHEKDNNDKILKSLVKPNNVKPAYENYSSLSSRTYKPRFTNSVQMPSIFQGPLGSVASNKGSVVKFEDQKYDDNKLPLDDTFTREEHTLTASASQPIIKNTVSGRYNTQLDDDEENFNEKNLRLMYPEPGYRDTFVDGVHHDSHVRRIYLSPDRAMEKNPYYQLGSTYSQRKTGSVAMTRNSFDVATKYASGVPPSYGRIIGLSRRLDKGVSDRMKLDDAQKDHQEAIKELVNHEKSMNGFGKTAPISPRQMSQFQSNALNMINQR